MPKSEPQSEHDWTIHSINIHGVFFERWCQKTVAKTQEWRVKSTNYPVNWHDKESNLDIRAEYQEGESITTLLIECKKNNPDFVNWVFFPKTRPSGESSICVPRITYSPWPEPRPGWQVNSSIATLGVPLRLADEARETRSGYLDFKAGSKTKTSNAAITDAAWQVALATQFVYFEEVRFSRTLGQSGAAPNMPYRSQLFLPSIITSANLFTCDFDPSDVDPATGEVPFNKAHLKEVPAIIFEYPLPRFLYNPPGDIVETLTRSSIEVYIRRHIFVVHSTNLNEELHTVTKWAKWI